MWRSGLARSLAIRIVRSMLDSPRFPADLPACHALLAEFAKAITSLEQRVDTQQKELVEQKLTIDELLRRAFQKRSERYLENPDQLQLDFGDSPEVADATDGLCEAIEQAQREATDAANEVVVPEHTRRKHAPRKPRNEQLPAHLPRVEVEAAPSPTK